MKLFGSDSFGLNWHENFFGLDRNETVWFGYIFRNDSVNFGLVRNKFQFRNCRQGHYNLFFDIWGNTEIYVYKLKFDLIQVYKAWIDLKAEINMKRDPKVSNLIESKLRYFEASLNLIKKLLVAFPQLLSIWI